MIYLWEAEREARMCQVLEGAGRYVGSGSRAQGGLLACGKRGGSSLAMDVLN